MYGGLRTNLTPDILIHLIHDKMISQCVNLLFQVVRMTVVHLYNSNTSTYLFLLLDGAKSIAIAH